MMRRRATKANRNRFFLEMWERSGFFESVFFNLKGNKYILNQNKVKEEDAFTTI